MPPQSEGPRLEEFEMGVPEVFPSTDPTQKTFTESVLIFLGGVIVDTPGPEFPAENTTAIPAASTALKVET